jgi:hypothetical protein
MWSSRRSGSSPAEDLLDSISLTAIMTDPSPRSVPVPEPHPGDLLGDLRDPVPAAQRAAEAAAAATAAAASTTLTARLRGGVETTGRRLRNVRWPDRPRRKIAIGAGAGAFLILCVSLLAGGVFGPSSATPPATHHASGPIASRLVVHTSHLNLAPATTAPAPALPLVAQARTASHEVFGYAPYWSLPQSSSFPVDDLSTIAYFSVDVNSNGSIAQSGPGWQGYQSQDLVNLVTRAHQAGDRVVLTATDFSQASLDTLTHSPGAGIILGNSLLELVQTKGLDGVNLDFEGVGSADQAGLDRIAADVNLILHVADPHYQFTMATYASSAGDPNGFYDIRTLSGYVDAFFVMAYDVSQGTSGQSAENAGGVDGTYVAQYLSAVPASKVILGVPLFGYDVPTTGPDLGDAATGPSSAVTYAQAMSSGSTFWDPTAQTAWTAYQSGGQWHQVFFDNANTLALKEELASTSNLLGVGVWALGMEGNDNSIFRVLDGGSPPLRVPPVGPAAAGSDSVSNVGTTGTGSGNASGSGAGHHHGGRTGTGAGKATTTTTRVKAETTTTAPSRTTTTTGPTTTTSSSTTTTSEPSATSTTTSTSGGTTISGNSTTTGGT